MYMDNKKEMPYVAYSTIHGKGAFTASRLKKNQYLGRYAPDMPIITQEEADRLPDKQQDYLVYIGEHSQHFTTKVNHSFRKANVELDTKGHMFCTRDIPGSTAIPCELLMNTGLVIFLVLSIANYQSRFNVACDVGYCVN